MRAVPAQLFCVLALEGTNDEPSASTGPVQIRRQFASDTILTLSNESRCMHWARGNRCKERGLPETPWLHQAKIGQKPSREGLGRYLTGSEQGLDGVGVAVHRRQNQPRVAPLLREFREPPNRHTHANRVRK